MRKAGVIYFSIRLGSPARYRYIVSMLILFYEHDEFLIGDSKVCNNIF